MFVLKFRWCVCGRGGGMGVYKEKVTGERTNEEQINVTMNKSHSNMGGGAEGTTHPAGGGGGGILTTE